ncbi:hypothetical protein [Halobacteriovorax sp. JY17]|uniref:hypothetical protein n=1 Tax=Halobacteriovorax sp. JY17 TaxID=2014617 RepID=UPI000C4F2D10|nr:hypothetical protein [Halobacteriovorax sp. JY17]PIK14053.1 MAG: hypothetical protein CES88_13805 [Halobacteriovorax sp. JY17]
MKKIFFLFLFFTVKSFALPDHVHFFFISPETVSIINEIGDEEIKFSKLTAKNITGGELDCVPMGDGCFNPQIGFVEDQSKSKPIAKEQPAPHRTINATDVDMINCEKGNYFDIFCGKAKKESGARAEVEVWLDTSSSMRTVDYNKDASYCERRIIARKFREGCGEKVNIQLFDTSIKQMGDLASACVNYGLNDQKRLMRWINDSSVKQLYVFTDIDELSLELKDYLDSIPSTIYGGDQKRYTMEDVHEMTDKAVANYCK